LGNIALGQVTPILSRRAAVLCRMPVICYRINQTNRPIRRLVIASRGYHELLADE